MAVTSGLAVTLLTGWYE